MKSEKRIKPEPSNIPKVNQPRNDYNDSLVSRATLGTQEEEKESGGNIQSCDGIEIPPINNII